MDKRGKFINSLVLCVYLFYTLFPLFYSVRGTNAEGGGYVNPSSSTVQRSIAGKDLLLVPSGERDLDGSSAPVEQILLKKKRALAPSFKEIVPKLFTQYVNLPDFDPSFKIASGLMQIPVSAQNCQNGFSYYHSGISPPSA